MPVAIAEPQMLETEEFESWGVAFRPLSAPCIQANGRKSKTPTKDCANSDTLGLETLIMEYGRQYLLTDGEASKHAVKCQHAVVIVGGIKVRVLFHRFPDCKILLDTSVRRGSKPKPNTPLFVRRGSNPKPNTGRVQSGMADTAIEHADPGGVVNDTVVQGDVHVVAMRRDVLNSRRRLAVQAQLDKISPFSSKPVGAEQLKQDRQRAAAQGGIVLKTAAKVKTDERTWQQYVDEQELQIGRASCRERV